MKKRTIVLTLAGLIVFVLLTLLLTHKRNPFNIFLNNVTDTIVITDHDALTNDIKKSIDEIAKNIASPVEIAASLKEFKYEYSKKLLLDIKVSNYQQAHEQAIALGGIGVDLMYINFYEKSTDMLTPLNQIRKLSQDLHISQFFDYALLKELTSMTLTKENLDTIIYITTYNINRIEDYFLTSNRAEIGIFMVLGAWTEGIYLLSEHAIKYRDEKIYERLAEQKFFIQELHKMLLTFDHNEHINDVLREIEHLKELLFAIEFKYENLGKPWKTVDDKGNPAWYQWKKSIALINTEQVNAISTEVRLFRKKMFKL